MFYFSFIDIFDKSTSSDGYDVGINDFSTQQLFLFGNSNTLVYKNRNHCYKIKEEFKDEFVFWKHVLISNADDISRAATSETGAGRRTLIGDLLHRYTFIVPDKNIRIFIGNTCEQLSLLKKREMKVMTVLDSLRMYISHNLIINRNSEQYKHVRFGQLFEQVKTRDTKNSERPFVGLHSDSGIVSTNIRTFKNEPDRANRIVGKTNDVVFGTHSVNNKPAIASIHQRGSSDFSVSPAYITIRPRTTNHDEARFVSGLLTCDEVSRTLEMVSIKSVRVIWDNDLLFDIEIPVPDKAHQRRVGAWLRLLDNIINKQQSKLHAISLIQNKIQQFIHTTVT